MQADSCICCVFIRSVKLQRNFDIFSGGYMVNLYKIIIRKMLAIIDSRSTADSSVVDSSRDEESSVGNSKPRMARAAITIMTMYLFFIFFTSFQEIIIKKNNCKCKECNI